MSQKDLTHLNGWVDWKSVFEVPMDVWLLLETKTDKGYDYQCGIFKLARSDGPIIGPTGDFLRWIRLDEMHCNLQLGKV